MSKFALLFVSFFSLSLIACFHEDDASTPANDSPQTYPGDIAQSEKPRDEQPQIATADLQTQVLNNTAFAFDLFNTVKTDESLDNKNLVFSPFSISLTLAMLSAGAANNTLTQINDALHFNNQQATLHSAFNLIDLHYKSLNGDFTRSDNTIGSITLNISNLLWGQKDFSIEMPFLDTLAINYGAGVNLVDFTTDHEAARLQINDWVSQQTNNKINDAMPSGSVDALTRLVLTNTVYFNGEWLYPFPDQNTQNRDFSLLDNTSVSTAFMAQTASFNYIEQTDAIAVELDYISSQLSMLVIMPNAGTYFNYESQLSPTSLNEVINGLQNTRIDLKFPKFDFDTSIPLAVGLKTLGMTDAFDPALSDFSKINPQATDLHVQSAVHKAFIIVDEKGTEAGAFTGIGTGITSVPPTVLIDQPFMFFIRDSETGSLLFFGRVLNPAE